MKKTYLISLAIILASFGLVQAETMSGSTYIITSSVLGGGGGPMVSGSGAYEMNGTIGQPSPLADPATPVTGGTYELKPGFWNTVGSCPFDKEPDGDIDGIDLASYALAGDFSQIQQFALAFGQNCP